MKLRRSEVRELSKGWERFAYEPPNTREELRPQHEWLECAEPILRLLQTALDRPEQSLMLRDRDGRVRLVAGGDPAGARGQKPQGESPIHDPLTNEIVGVLGVAGFEETSHPRAAELLAQVVDAIERSIRDRELAHRGRLLEEFARMTERYPADPLVAVDRRGVLIAASPSTARTLGGSEVPLGRKLDEVPGLRELFAPPGGKPPSGSVSVSDSGRPIGTLLLGRSERPRSPRHPPCAWTATHTLSDLRGTSRSFRRAIDLAERAGASDWPVLLLGESGTGKELLAHAIHNASTRKAGPFVPFSCAAIGDEILGAELFGYEEGSFTGALKGGRLGKVQIAHRGTLFLDDVDTMSPKMQASLLRLLEEGVVLPIGSLEPCPVDIRVIAASNHDLEELIQRGGLRRDLYFRLGVIRVRLPPLRERPEDVLELARHFLAKHAPRARLTDAAGEALLAHAWPGNVRELRNVLIEAAIKVGERNRIEAEDLAIASTGGAARRPGPDEPPATAGRDARGALRRAMAEADNMRHAASLLGVHPSTLYRRLRREGIEPSLTYRRRHADAGPQPGR